MKKIILSNNFSGLQKWFCVSGLAAISSVAILVLGGKFSLLGIALIAFALVLTFNLQLACIICIPLCLPTIEILKPFITNQEAILEYTNHYILYSCLVVLALAWLKRSITEPQHIYLHPLLCTLLSAWLIICVLSLVWTYDPYFRPHEPAILRSFAKLGLSKLALETFMLPGLMIFVMSAFEKEDQLERFFWVIVLTAVPLGIATFFTGFEMDEGVIVRSQGVYRDPHSAAAHQFIACIFAVSLFRCSKGLKQIFLLGFILLSLWIITVIASSRTTIVALLLVTLLSGFLEGGFRRLVSYVFWIGIIGFVAFPLMPGPLYQGVSAIISSLVGLLDPRSLIETSFAGVSLTGTFTDRIIYLQGGLQLFSQHPIIGVGLGKHIDLFLNYVWHPFPMIHTYYMIVLVETGIIGLIAFLLFVFCGCYLGWRALSASRQSGNRRLFFLTEALVLGYAGVLVLFTFFPGYLEARYFWTFLGLFAVLNRLNRSTETHSLLN